MNAAQDTGLNDEIGSVPEGWNVVRFSAIREWLQYGTSTRCTYEHSDYPVLRIPNIEPGHVNTDDLKYCTLNRSEADRYRLERGDLIFIRTNGVLARLGSCAVYQDKPVNALFASYLIRARLNLERADPQFVAYFFASERGNSIIAGRATPAADGKYNLNTGTIDSLPVPLPPTLGEQHAIATALSAVREAIRLHDHNVTVTNDLKRAAMATLFTRGTKGETQKETKIGLMPESWDIAAIGDVSLTTQYGLSVRGQPSGAYPILRMNCQEDGAVHYRNLQYVDLDPATYEGFRLRPGDLLFNRTNSIELVGRMAIIDDEQPAVFASYLVRLTVDTERCLPRFLNYFMNWPATQDEIKKLASRAVGQANINASKLRTVLFPLPPTLDEQQEIVDILDAIDRKIGLHKKKRAALDELFKSLLHKLMTGEIRVADLDLSVLGRAPLEGVAA